MSTKTKNTKTSSEKLVDAAQQAGLILMTAAFTIGMVEMPEHSNAKAVLPNQPSFAFVHDQGGSGTDNTMRREREEAGPHYISYNTAQRTPGRTGKV